MSKKRSNPRFECKGCNARNSRNQLLGSNGFCPHCKTPMHHSSWMGGVQANISQLLKISKEDERVLKEIAEEAELDIIDLIRAGFLNRLNTWVDSDDPAKSAKADTLLQKLGQR